MMMGIGQMMMEVEGRVFLLNIQPRLVIIVTSWRLWLGSLYGIVVRRYQLLVACAVVRMVERVSLATGRRVSVRSLRRGTYPVVVVIISKFGYRTTLSSHCPGPSPTQHVSQLVVSNRPRARCLPQPRRHTLEVVLSVFPITTIILDLVLITEREQGGYLERWNKSKRINQKLQ